MNYRYRIKGTVEKAFILRGMHFRIGTSFDTPILESELTFVKERCKISDIVDTEQVSDQNPIPKNSSKQKKGEKHELQKSAIRTDKNADNAKV